MATVFPEIEPNCIPTACSITQGIGACLMNIKKTHTHHTHTHTHTHHTTHTPINIYFLPAYQHTQLVVVPRALRFQFPVIYDMHTTVQDLKAVNIKTAVIYSVEPCILVHGYHLFGASRALSHRGIRGPYAPHKYFVPKYQNIRCHIPEACNRNRF
jgi:hypothetical protein